MSAIASRLDLRVRQLTYESDGVVSVRLVGLDGAALPAWEPGAHVDLRLAGGLVRQYSLCGSTADRGQYAVAVLHEPPDAADHATYTSRCGRRLGRGRGRATPSSSNPRRRTCSSPAASASRRSCR